MQITKEQLQSEINATEANLKTVNAQANQIAGALAVLKNMLAYLEAEPPKPREDISAANKAVQESIEAKMKEMSVDEFIETVGGKGATGEIVEENTDNG